MWQTLTRVCRPRWRRSLGSTDVRPILHVFVSNDDIERGAKDLIDQYGGEASQEAEQRAQKMAQAGNLKGERVWRQIIDKLNELTGLPAESFEADI